ncbi:MAG: nucleotidyltransferase family protein [Lentimicrobiaceae bacterium]|jgi:dTDP-glucose pyrophosphorylase|nr:nucleotidyltransferase family protein [Lentimicrobiaceae bacterium]MDD4596460.1 nucleotidyltransferase family protein [Lentimicrobiaceae bacterium]
MNVMEMNKHLVNEDVPLRLALEQLNRVPDSLTLFVKNQEEQIVGTLTDGDVRRGLLEGFTLEDAVGKFMFHAFSFLNESSFTLAEVDRIRERRIKLLPVLDDTRKIVRLADMSRLRSLLPLEVVLMAGGRGERLRPLTDNTPKPLLKVGDKPIIAHTIDHLRSFGITRFHIALNYKGEMIRDYFKDGSEREINISYLNETAPLGTLGATRLIQDFSFPTVLVMNADILTNIDVEDFYRDFIQQEADMSVASVPYKVNMPFAVLETSQSRVISFQEKPQFTYYTNGGIYLLRPELISRIEPGQAYQATDLMDNLLARNEKLIQYPLHGVWMDIGRKEDFDKAQEEIKHLKF